MRRIRASFSSDDFDFSDSGVTSSPFHEVVEDKLSRLPMKESCFNEFNPGVPDPNDGGPEPTEPKELVSACRRETMSGKHLCTHTPRNRRTQRRRHPQQTTVVGTPARHGRDHRVQRAVFRRID